MCVLQYDYSTCADKEMSHDIQQLVYAYRTYAYTGVKYIIINMFINGRGRGHVITYERAEVVSNQVKNL